MAHTKRKPIEENLHDTIIDKLARQLQEKKKQVKTNKGNCNQNAVQNSDKSKPYYPDIFVHTRTKVTEIYEVETESTVNENSIPQWKKYSSDTAKFYLVVPKDMLNKAKILASKHKISVEDYYVF